MSSPNEPARLRPEDGAQKWTLLCTAGKRLCAVPLEHVRETMRPLPAMAVVGAPPCVRGLARIRCASLPVVDLAELLGEPREEVGRFVTVAAGTRQVALAVSSVVDVRAIEAARLEPLPPLLSEAAVAVNAIGRLDAELLLVLSAMQLLQDDVPESTGASS